MKDLTKYQTFNEDFSLAGKTAIITGAGSGIGYEIAKMFARKGANVVSVDRKNSADLKDYMESLQAQYMEIEGDLLDEDFVDRQIAEKVTDRFGKIDVLVNCAGVGILENLEVSTRKIWNLTLGVNLTAAVHLALSVGHNAGLFVKIAQLLDIPYAIY